MRYATEQYYLNKIARLEAEIEILKNRLAEVEHLRFQSNA